MENMMNIKQHILGLTVEDRDFAEEEMFSTVIKSFAHDYMIDEDALGYYIEVFGEDTKELFDFLADNYQQLNEFVLKYDGVVLEAEEKDIKDFYLLNEQNDYYDEKVKQMRNDKISREFGEKSEKLMDRQKEALAKQAEYKNDDTRERMKDRISSLSGTHPVEFHSKETLKQPYPYPSKYTDMKERASELVNPYSYAKPSNMVNTKLPEPEVKAPITTAMKASALKKTVATKGFLANLWDKIKHFGGGIKKYFALHPALLRTLGIAGAGVAGILAIRKMMKNAREQKEAQRAREARA
jgi:uncharacterized membrane-anchored protein YhcB (DUF1043 family)